MAEIVAFLTSHRDAYKFLHDQTVRLMNSGFTASEIAEVLKLPDVLAKQWFNRGYYGTMSHNSKAIYQRYLGWYDANPANLNPLPPEPAAKRYVEAMGGATAVMALAEKAEADGELRWAATLLNHVVFADEHNTTARERLAGIYTKLAFESEAGTWRNIYLTGAQELRHGVAHLPPGGMSIDVLTATTTPMLLDFAAVRVNPSKASERTFKINIELTDRNEKHLITVENGVLIHEAGVSDARRGRNGAHEASGASDDAARRGSAGRAHRVGRHRSRRRRIVVRGAHRVDRADHREFSGRHSLAVTRDSARFSPQLTAPLGRNSTTVANKKGPSYAHCSR